jgi:methionyl-tRNA synthetase
VNGKPHVGHALELVETDVLARHRRQRGDEVRFQTGTDDNALKNVQGAEAEGISPAEYVERVAQGFLALWEALDLSFNDFIKTSSDPHHKPGVDKFWAACAECGDLYRFDALTNYITAPGYGTDEENLRYWWDDADERVHVIGKGIIRLHRRTPCHPSQRRPGQSRTPRPSRQRRP